MGLMACLVLIVIAVDLKGVTWVPVQLALAGLLAYHFTLAQLMRRQYRTKHPRGRNFRSRSQRRRRRTRRSTRSRRLSRI